jgi:hypothetical protein
MKFVINSLDEVPEAFRSEYEAKGGKFHLKGEGEYAPLVESNQKLAEFRDNNRALNTKVTELTGQLKTFEGVDVTEYTALKTKVTELENAGVKDKSSVADLVKAAVKAAVTPLEEKLTAREQSERQAQEALARTGLENKLREVGMKMGVDERALPDYVNRGMQVFKLVEGQPAARKGDQPIFSKTKPADELSMEEWAGELQQEAPFLFKPSRGGGAGNNSGSSQFTGQRKVISSDPLEFGRNLESIAKGETIVQQ